MKNQQFAPDHRLRVGVVGAATVFICIVVLVAPLRAEDWRKRLFDEAPKSWDAMREFYTHVDGSLTITETFVMPGNTASNFTKRTPVEFLVSGSCVRAKTPAATFLVGKNDSAIGEDTLVACINTRYEFILTQRPTASDWGIKHVEAGRRDSTQELAFRNWAHYVWAPWSILGGTSYKEFLDRPGCEVKGVEANGASNVITVTFTYSPPEQEVKERSRTLTFWALRGGKLVFSPKEQWSLIESKLSFQTMTERMVVEYGELTGRYRAPKRVIRTANGSGPSAFKYEFDVAIDKLVSREAKEQEFTLAAFGLPDSFAPIREAPVSTRWWLWGSLAGGALLGLAVVFSWVRQRAKR